MIVLTEMAPVAVGLTVLIVTRLVDFWLPAGRHAFDEDRVEARAREYAYQRIRAEDAAAAAAAAAGQTA